jgi:hypothetical protein
MAQGTVKWLNGDKGHGSHPTGAQERIYQRSGLLMEVWLLTF